MLLRSSFTLITIFIGLFSLKATAQESNLYLAATTIQKRATLYQNLTKNIKRDLLYSLKDDHDDKWLDAIASLELLQFKDEPTNKRIENAIDSIGFLSDELKKQLIQLAYSNYPGIFKNQILELIKKISDPEVFAYGAEYILRNKNDSFNLNQIKLLLHQKFPDFDKSNTILTLLQNHIDQELNKNPHFSSKLISDLINKHFLPGEIILYSFQRSNRDFPGLVLIRKPNGTFIKDSANNFYNVPQLARSITNMPYYLKYGNTPQGLYKMNGFGVSMSSFIGPTPNIQLQMPVEVSLQTFFKDSTITDTAWNLSYYEKLLPPSLKKYKPIYECYYAGAVGRTEIIAHGSTINPDYYYGHPYFPHTPSEGCLTTSEIWNGKRLQSNQQLIINGLLSAGGAHGYCLVIDIDDKNAPVKIEDLLPFLKAAEKE